jgi:hypothetical protein
MVLPEPGEFYQSISTTFMTTNPCRVRLVVLTLALAAWALSGGVSRAQTQSVALTPQNGGSSGGCPKSYKAYAYLVSSTGTSHWTNPPAGSTHCFISVTPASSCSNGVVYAYYENKMMLPNCGTNGAPGGTATFYFPVSTNSDIQPEVFLISSSNTNYSGQTVNYELAWKP